MNANVAAWILFAAGCPGLAQEPKVEQQELGPVAQDVQYVVSARNGHLATIGHKGSRVLVTVDGVSGPKFDEIVTAKPWIDPRGVPPERIQAQPVVFSPDGNRYAYVARQSQELVLVVDGKEVSRQAIPGSAGNLDVHVAFAGDDAKRILYAQSNAAGLEFWIDGQKQPGTYSSSGGDNGAPTDPALTRDGAHCVYVAQIERDKRALILDGKDAGYLGENPQFTADGQHLFCSARQGPFENLIIDGKPKIKTDGVHRLCMAPVGNTFAAVLQRVKPPGEFLIVNGKKIEGSDGTSIARVLFSPDGKRCAALCVASPTTQFVLLDGKKGHEYLNIPAGTIAFSPDSAKLGYVAQAGSKSFVVINEDESDDFDVLPNFAFSADGKHVVYSGSRRGSPPLTWPVYVDGKAEQITQGNSFETFQFSPDGKRYAYCGVGGPSGVGQPILVDGKDSGLLGKFAFSADSKHLACAAYRASDGKRGMFLDGKLVYANERAIRNFAFTPDSQHLYWIVSEPGQDPANGQADYVTYADGVVVARCDNNTAFGMLVVLPPPTRSGLDGQLHEVKELPSGWQVGPDGVLTLIGPVGPVVKRFRVTPASDSNLATLLAKAPK